MTTTPTADQVFYRAAPVTDIDEDARQYTAIGVPFGQVTNHEFGAENFEAGSVRDPDDGAPAIFDEHREPIGYVLSSIDTPAGRQIRVQISDTVRGRDVWTLIKDRVYRSMSIGFRPVAWRLEDDGVITFTEVIVYEYSTVIRPAYTGAVIDPTTIRTTLTKEPNMTATVTEPTPDIVAVRSELTSVNTSIEDLKREVQLLGASSPSTGDALPSTAYSYRSMGDFLKAIAAGDSDAATFHRAYTGGTIADAALADTFVGDLIKLVADRRRVMDLFSKGTLPATGASVDYRRLLSNTTQVGKQAAEGDDLPKGKIVLERKNAEVETYGGATELSLQEVLRGTGAELQTTLEALAIQYARQTDTAVATSVASTMVTNLAGESGVSWLPIAAGATADAWLDLIIDAAVIYETNGFSLTGMIAGKDRFKELAHLKDGDRRLMSVTQDSQGMKIGHLILPGLTGDLAGVRVQLAPKLAATALSFYDPLAIKTLESAGAPAQLQDENIINLTKAFSLYGFMATLVPFPQALLPVAGA